MCFGCIRSNFELHLRKLLLSCFFSSTRLDCMEWMNPYLVVFLSDNISNFKFPDCFCVFVLFLLFLFFYFLFFVFSNILSKEGFLWRLFFFPIPDRRQGCQRAMVAWPTPANPVHPTRTHSTSFQPYLHNIFNCIRSIDSIQILFNI